MNDIKNKWSRMLRAMLDAYRRKHPSDTVTDRELLESLIEYFYKSGVVQKTENGRYILSDIDGTIPERLKL